MYLNDDRDDVAFLGGSGSSESRYSKRDLYERGHVAVCSHKQAICITVFVFTSILLTSVAIAFVRPWNECGLVEMTPEVNDEPVIPIATNGELFPWNDVRLPKFIKPISYDLDLTPNLTTLAVKGIIKLIFQVTEKTDFIVFHAKNMNITSKTINEKLLVERCLEYPERDQVYFGTDKNMNPGKTYSVRLKFQYALEENLEGFYLSTYRDSKGEKRQLASTHFEPVSARHAFPCFDEPDLKAKFLVTITHDKTLTSFFNTPIKEQGVVRGKPNQVRTEFEETVMMSTYLVAFVVCDFKTIEDKTKSNVSIRVIAAEDKIDQAKFALQEAVKILEFYEDYFGIPYPLPKQDLVAIPNFGAGAMENWGLITYRETALLYEEGVSSPSEQQWVGTVVAHELAHQWFGNLVTMKWWNDLWLNEGFASWMEYKGLGSSQSQWGMMEQFWSNVMLPALHLDSLASSHPVSVPVEDPSDIGGIFDAISYKKGSSIIHMLEQYLSTEEVRKGLQLYLNEFKYSNAVTRDLWSSFTKATNDSKDIEHMMNTWTLQMGYPIITFTKNAPGTNTWNITQKRFLLSEKVNKENTSSVDSTANQTWVVPVNFKTNLGVSGNVLLSSEVNNTGAKVELSKDIKWLKGNMNGTGYYRVNYPKEIWEGLVDQLLENHTVFSPTDRAQIIDDAFTLCRAGHLDSAIPMRLSRYLLKETHLVPWKTALVNLETFAIIFRETHIRELLENYTLHLIKNIYNELGWSDEGHHLQRLLRIEILRAAIHNNMESAVTTANNYFKDHMENKTNIPASFQTMAMKVGVQLGGRKEWEWCKEQYKSVQVPTQRVNYLKALAESRDIYVIQDYLDMILNKSEIRTQDIKMSISSVANNPTATLAAWRHLRQNWDRYYDALGSSTASLGGVIWSVCHPFSTQFDLEQVEHFFRGKKVGSAEFSLKQTIEVIKVNIMFRENSESDIQAWLEKELHDVSENANERPK